jgi:hypothetical protein
MNGIAARRLHAQGLTGKPFATPVDALRWLTAVQSQDYSAAKWGLAQRSRQATDSGIDRLFDEGVILRTHVLRPTWHFVLPEDVRWLLDLTGPKIHRGLAARYRELELEDKIFERARKAFIAALAGGRYLTRAELGEVLRRARIAPEGQRLPHLLMRAELDGLIVSGPRRGKQFTYALLEERAPTSRVLDRDAAIAELTRRYFRSHGPAQLQDFVWWSGLRLADARSGVRFAGSALDRDVIEGKEYWFDAKAGRAPDAPGVAHLLPNFDVFTVAYRDRSDILPAERTLEPAIILSNVVTVGGKVRATWRRTLVRNGIRVEVRATDQLKPAERASVEEAGRRFGRFLGRPTEVTWPE